MKDKGKTDEEISIMVQQGDTEAFGVLVDRYESKIKRYARKFVSDREDISDLVQDVFIKAYTNIKSFNAERRFSPWIYRIAHNEFVNGLKKKLSDKLFPFDFDLLFPHPVAEETADSDAHKKELKHMMDKSIGTLSPKYREPLVLYYYEEMDYKEIAGILEIPTSTVGVRINRGKAILKNIIQELDQQSYGKRT
jgi:RNA polymerase sigma-70 factor (ECF subfamily)